MKYYNKVIKTYTYYNYIYKIKINFINIDFLKMYNLLFNLLKSKSECCVGHW